MIYGQEMFEYFIVIDDDQLVKPDTIMQVWNNREPNTYAAWWVKSFSSFHPDYLKPLNIENNQYHGPLHYAGPGMSVLDAKILNVPALFNNRYALYDDILLSFIVLNLQNWKIKRITPDFIRDVDKSNSELRTKIKHKKAAIWNQMCSCPQMSNMFVSSDD